MTEEMKPAIPAATLVLMRDSPAGAPELLMVERGAGMVFAGGAMVFPGGRIDPGDHAVASDRALVGDAAGWEDAAARVAAIRETIEEVGIAPGFASPLDTDGLTGLRRALASGSDFGPLLAERGWTLDLAALMPWSRWRPNFNEKRTFDTRFFLAAAPAGSVATADGGESVRAIWASAAAVLADADAGHHQIIFPTRRNLERLAPHASFAAARDFAAGHEPRMITPWVEEREGERWLCIPDDLGYPVTGEPLSAVRRG